MKQHPLVTIAARDGKEYDINRIQRRSRQIAKPARATADDEEEEMPVEIITFCDEGGGVEVSSCNLEEGSCCGHLELSCGPIPHHLPLKGEFPFFFGQPLPMSSVTLILGVQ